MTNEDMIIVARLLQGGDVDYINNNLPEDYHIHDEIDEFPDWGIVEDAWLDIIRNELLPVAKEQCLSLHEVMDRYTNGGSEFNWPKEMPWNVDFEQDDPRQIMRQALMCINEDEFPKSLFECE